MNRRHWVREREVAVAAREHAVAAREEAAAARGQAIGRRDRVSRWVLVVTVIGALGGWGGPIAQSLLDDRLANEPARGSCSRPGGALTWPFVTRS